MNYTLKYRGEGVFDFYAPGQADKLPVISLRVTRRDADVALNALVLGRSIPDYLLPQIVPTKKRDAKSAIERRYLPLQRN